MVSKVWVLALLLATASAGELDGLVNVIEGFYETYAEEPFNSATCLPESLQTDLITEASALAEDFIQEHSFAMMFSHAYAVYDDLSQVATGCSLVPVADYVQRFVAKEGIDVLWQTVVKNKTILEGVVLQTAQDALVHDWDAVGKDLGTLLALVVPPMIN